MERRAPRALAPRSHAVSAPLLFAVGFALARSSRAASTHHPIRSNERTPQTSLAKSDSISISKCHLCRLQPASRAAQNRVAARSSLHRCFFFFSSPQFCLVSSLQGSSLRAGARKRVLQAPGPAHPGSTFTPAFRHFSPLCAVAAGWAEGRRHACLQPHGHWSSRVLPRALHAVQHARGRSSQDSGPSHEPHEAPGDVCMSLRANAQTQFA